MCMSSDKSTRLQACGLSGMHILNAKSFEFLHLLLFLVGGHFLHAVGKFDIRPFAWFEVRLPLLVRIHIGINNDVAILEDIEFDAQLRFTACGNPDIIGDQAGANASSFFGFD